MDGSTLPVKKRKLLRRLSDHDESLDQLQEYCASSSTVVAAHDVGIIAQEPGGKSQPRFKKLKFILGGVVLQEPAADSSSSTSKNYTKEKTAKAKNKKSTTQQTHKKTSRTENNRRKKNVGAAAAAAEFSLASAANDADRGQGCCSAPSPSSTNVASVSASPTTFVDTLSCYPERIARCPELVRRLDELGVERPVHVMRKRISATDVSKKQHRLLLPKAQLDKAALHRVMTPRDAVEASGEGLGVKLVNRTGREYPATLRLLGCNNDYRIKGRGYWRFVEDNGWEKNEILDVWLCRTKLQQQKPEEEDEELGGEVGRNELKVVLLHYSEAAAAVRPDDEATPLRGATADEVAIAGTLLELRVLRLAETSMHQS